MRPRIPPRSASVALMKESRAKTVFGFDRHFERAGFQLWIEANPR